MASSFKLSAISLAVILACSSTGVYARHNHSNTKPVTTDSQATAIQTMPASNSPLWRWDPTAPIMPDNYSQFMTWAQDINGGKSNEHLFSCWRGMLCVSGLLDLDALYFNRSGIATGTAAESSGAGVRPLFGDSTSQLNGSINNANLFIDLKFEDLVRIHSNIAYVNGAVKEASYHYHDGADWRSVFSNASAIRADEIYAVFSNQRINPLYLKIGRMYLDFGQYTPNAYGLPTITPSLTQLMTQTRAGGAELGFAFENGVYGSATWFMNQMSMTGFYNAARNYSAKLGFMRQFTNVKTNINLSYIWDITDTDYMSEGLYVLNTAGVPSYGDNDFGVFHIRRQHAFAGHADVKYKQLAVALEGAAVTGPLNPNNPNSTLWTAGIDVSYDFPTFSHKSSLDLGYQISRHAVYIYGSGIQSQIPFVGFPVGPFSYQLPLKRVVATYIVNVVPHVNLGLQWVHDTDFGKPSGTNLTSDFGVFRIDLEF